MIFYFIRHGQTQFNLENRYYGKLEAELTNVGKSMTKKLAQTFTAQVDTIYCSSQLRARHTLAILQGERPDLKKVETVYTEQLAERNFGSWEGMTANDIQDRDPEAWRLFIEDPFQVTPRGAESYQDFATRVKSAFEELIEKDVESVLMVGHQGVFRVLIHEYFEEDKDFWDISFDQDRYYRYEI